MMPAILYGTAWKKERTAELVRLAVEVGFRGFDTAAQPRHYSEAGVGAGIKAAGSNGLQRNDFYLQTKFSPLTCQDPRNLPYDPDAALADQVAQSVASSLANLRTDCIDGLILHSPFSAAAQTQEVWRAMERAVDAGLVRQLGISNCYDVGAFRSLYEQARIKPAVLQNRFYAATGYDRRLRALCRDWGVIYQSFWTLTANGELLADPIMLSIAEHLGRTPAQVLFRYLTHSGIVPLTGTTSVQHMLEDLAIFEFDLAEEDRRKLDRLLID